MSRKNPRPPSAVEKLGAARAGEGVQLSASIWAFRVPKQRFRWGQSYALTRSDGTVLVDAVHHVTHDAVEDVLATSGPVRALLLTHADLLDQAFGSVDDLESWLDAPVVIHRADGRGTTDWELNDGKGLGDELLRDLDVQAIHVPGHTPGSVVYQNLWGGAIFCGDAAVGPSFNMARTGPGVSEWSHPPISPEDWPRFVEGWTRVTNDRGLSDGLFPLHGRPTVWWDGFDSHLDITFSQWGEPFVAALLAGGDRVGRMTDSETFGRSLLDPENVMRV